MIGESWGEYVSLVGLFYGVVGVMSMLSHGLTSVNHDEYGW